MCAMTPAFFKEYGLVIFAAIGALAIIGTAWWTKGSNAWLYVFCVWSILYAAFEVYSNMKKKRSVRS